MRKCLRIKMLAYSCCRFSYDEVNILNVTSYIILSHLSKVIINCMMSNKICPAVSDADNERTDQTASITSQKAGVNKQNSYFSMYSTLFVFVRYPIAGEKALIRLHDQHMSGSAYLY